MFRVLKQLRRTFRLLSMQVAKVGAALIWPIERFFQSTGQKVLVATEGVEQLEGGLAWLGRVITWPLRVSWRIVASFASRVLPEAAKRRLAAGVRSLGSLQRRAGQALMWAAEAINLDRLVLCLVWLMQPIWRPVAAVGGFFYSWAATRDFKAALWGLPAIIMPLPFILVFGWTFVFGSGQVVSQYRVAVKEALEEGDYERVQLYERKLAQLGIDTKRSDYRTALALAKDDKIEEAYARMQRLAPTDTPGYPSAHYWIIQKLLIEKPGVPPSESQRLIGAHLNHLQSLQIKGPEIQLLRAIWLARDKQFAKAAEVLEPFVNEVPEAADQRMRIHLAMNELEKAREDARSVRAHMQHRHRRESRLTTAEYRSWAIAEKVLGDHRQLKSVLQAWHENEPGNQSAKDALAAVFRREFERFLRSSAAKPEDMAARLLKSVDLATDLKWLVRLADVLYQQKAEIPVAEALVEQLLESSQTPSVVLIALGTSAVKAEEWRQAELIFLRATEKDQEDATAWNNLACVMSQGPEGNQKQALAAANRAIELWPNDFNIRETRGQILANMKRWQEAIEDLEFAANGLPHVSKIHQSLALAYEALDEKELAQAHRQQIE